VGQERQGNLTARRQVRTGASSMRAARIQLLYLGRCLLAAVARARIESR
jgi:hypothetical protein